MTPAQFRARLSRSDPAPAYLFLGAEAYQRDICRRALLERVLETGERESGLTRHDLDEVSLAEVLDDARSLSLFAQNRLIWVGSAESALPRGRVKSGDDASGAAQIADYIGNPTPGVVLVFEASRYELAGEGKKKAERVGKFYSAIPDKVEFPPYPEREAMALARQLAEEAGVRLSVDAIGLLVESAGSDAARIANEVEKLRLFAGEDGTVTETQLMELVPSARTANIFGLVDALGRSDRGAALEILDTLVRENEYLPLALSFLGTQFRQTLVAKEARLRSAQEIQSHFSKMGVLIWPARARQIQQTLAAFSTRRLKTVLQKIHLADRSLRDTRPDDRVIVEQLVFALTE